MDNDVAIEIDRLKKDELTILLDFIRADPKKVTLRNAGRDGKTTIATPRRESHAS